MTIDIEHLERAALAATPGPWKLCGTVEQTCGEYRDIIPTSVSCAAYCYGGSPERAEEADLEFIAAANPAVVLELIRRQRGLEQQRDQMLAALNKAFELRVSNHPEWEAIARAAMQKGGE